MAAGNSEGKNTKFYNLKQKASASDVPGWQLSEKVNGKWTPTVKHNYIEGMINTAKIVKKEINGEQETFFVLEMQDGDEFYVMTLPHGNLTYSLINSLASNCNSLSKYKITIAKKQNGEYWNAQGYINVDGSQDMLKWSTDPKATPQSVEVKGQDGQPLLIKGKKVWDDTKKREYWEAFFASNIIPKLTGNGTSNRPTTGTANSGGGAPVQNTGASVINNGAPVIDDNDDLPF